MVIFRIDGKFIHIYVFLWKQDTNMSSSLLSLLKNISNKWYTFQNRSESTDQFYWNNG